MIKEKLTKYWWVIPIILFLFYVLYSRQVSYGKTAISHCTDIEFVKYADSNPKLFITYDFADVIK